MSRNCKCMGNNPNCYICSGYGIIKDESIAVQTRTDYSLIASAKERPKVISNFDDCTYGDEVHTSGRINESGSNLPIKKRRGLSWVQKDRLREAKRKRKKKQK